MRRIRVQVAKQIIIFEVVKIQQVFEVVKVQQIFEVVKVHFYEDVHAPQCRA